MELILRKEGIVIFKAKLIDVDITQLIKLNEACADLLASHKNTQPRNHYFINEIQHYLKLYCDVINMDYYDITSRKRFRDYVIPRQAFMLVLKEYYPVAPLTSLAHAFNMTDHASVIHSIKTARDLLETKDKQMVYYIEKAKKVINAKEI